MLSDERLEPSPMSVPERWLVWYVFPLACALLSVAVGPLSGFDLINLRWMSGWVMISGADGLYGSVASLLTRPWLSDGGVALLLAPGWWWLGPAALGAAHGFIVPLVHACIRSVAPHLGRTARTVLASTSISTPLVLMHVGRETGHLLAALFLGLSVRWFLSHPERGLTIGLFLGFAPLLKVSAVFSAVALGLAFLIGLRGLERVRLVVGSSLALWFGAVVPSLLVAAKSGEWSIIWVWGQPVSLIRAALVSLSLVLGTLWLRRVHRCGRQLGGLAMASRHHAVLFVAGLSVLTWLGRRSGRSDPRFNPPTLGDLGKQLFMSGNARVPTALSDWEVLYLDNSRMVLVVFALVAVTLMLVRSNATLLSQRMELVALAIGGSVVFVQATMGYVRYASQSIALLPIAVACVVGLNHGRRLWREMMLLSVSAIILLPVADTGIWFRAPGMISYAGSSTLLAADEVRLLSGLLPKDATVFLFGNQTASAGPATGRTDVTWLQAPKRPEQIRSQFAELLYDPGQTRDLDKFTTRGWTFDVCQTLRFRNISYGWCSMRAEVRDQADSSTSPSG